MNDEYSEIKVVSVSIVSHQHAEMIESLLLDLCDIPEIYQVIITINTPERFPLVPVEIMDKVTFIHNDKPKGFGANHNAAFLVSKSLYFCVLNPDVRLTSNPFPTLIAALRDKGVGVVVPTVLDQDGKREDNARFFPTPIRLFNKFIWGNKGIFSNLTANDFYTPDWVAGMFMLFRRETFHSLKGFDERYYLYYEDVDICARVWKEGMSVVAYDSVSIIHQAQRSSHKRLKFTLWHLRSMLSFFAKHLFSLPR